MFNGIIANLAGTIIGAKSMYFCVGGPAEVLGGGINSENRLFGRIDKPSLLIEGQLLEIVKSFDVIITMGSKAAKYFKSKGIKQGKIFIVPGGIDRYKFTPKTNIRDIDIITVGRLEKIKRIDIFINIMAEIKEKKPTFRAAIIGGGSLLDTLKEQIEALKLTKNIVLVGYSQRDVENWLQRSKIFALTSDSEGLSLAMMEAMMCGLPAIVSDVGDLADLVENGKKWIPNLKSMSRNLYRENIGFNGRYRKID